MMLSNTHRTELVTHTHAYVPRQSPIEFFEQFKLDFNHIQIDIFRFTCKYSIDAVD